jgi:hypothetical protein
MDLLKTHGNPFQHFRQLLLAQNMRVMGLLLQRRFWPEFQYFFGTFKIYGALSFQTTHTLKIKKI